MCLYVYKFCNDNHIILFWPTVSAITYTVKDFKKFIEQVKLNEWIVLYSKCLKPAECNLIIAEIR